MYVCTLANVPRYANAASELKHTYVENRHMYLQLEQFANRVNKNLFYFQSML
jgi:hypothetical protein